MSIGQYRHRVTLEAPGDPVPDGDGGYTATWAPLDPPDWDCAIHPASRRALESIGAGTVTAQATHVVTGRYHPGITSTTRLTFGTRTLEVVYVANRDERAIETDLVCVEHVG
jgi:SPP1 family predicted phage head-tail adaptor